MKIYIIILLIILLLLISIFYGRDNPSGRDNPLPWLDTKSYPEIEAMYVDRSNIRNELNNLIDRDVWTVWKNGNEPSPAFTKMSREEILNKIQKGKSGINRDSKSWKLFGLYLKGNPIAKNIKQCPKTHELLKKIPNLINAGFSVLEPKSHINPHRGYDESFYRVHIPMIIPEGDCCLRVNGHTRKWKDSEFFIFDDMLEHEAWNNTDQTRIVLIIDIQR